MITHICSTCERLQYRRLCNLFVPNGRELIRNFNAGRFAIIFTLLLSGLGIKYQFILYRALISEKIRGKKMNSQQIMILGVGCILFSDEGFGVRVIEKIQQNYTFPDNVTIVDGGVLGVNLLGVISQPDHLIVVDAIRNKGNTGDLYRLEGDAIPERIRAKNSLHQVDFLEALTLCQALDKVPKTVIVGIEPEDIETLSIELTPAIQKKVDPVIDMVLSELDRLCVSYKKGASKNVPCNPI